MGLITPPHLLEYRLVLPLHPPSSDGCGVGEDGSDHDGTGVLHCSWKHCSKCSGGQVGASSTVCPTLISSSCTSWTGTNTTLQQPAASGCSVHIPRTWYGCRSEPQSDPACRGSEENCSRVASGTETLLLDRPSLPAMFFTTSAAGLISPILSTPFLINTIFSFPSLPLSPGTNTTLQQPAASGDPVHIPRTWYGCRSEPQSDPACRGSEENCSRVASGTETLLLDGPSLPAMFFTTSAAGLISPILSTPFLSEAASAKQRLQSCSLNVTLNVGPGESVSHHVDLRAPYWISAALCAMAVGVFVVAVLWSQFMSLKGNSTVDDTDETDGGKSCLSILGPDNDSNWSGFPRPSNLDLCCLLRYSITLST
eukprot:sb/3465873/